MLRIVIKAGLIALLSMAISLLLAITLVPALGGVVDGNAWLMCAICPLVIAFPASFHTIWQKQRLVALHGELQKTHLALQQAHAKLAEKSRHDAMTGFLTREAFFAVLDGSRRKVDRGSLLLIDADYFKRINDTYGHLVGDDALIDIAASITGLLREGDVVGRIGGEEFGVFLPGTDKVEGCAIAERIRLAVQDITFMPAQGATLTLTVSVGGVVCWADAAVTTLIREADRHLYQAKNAGRNRVVFEGERRLAA